MAISIVFYILFVLFIKHLIIDFPIYTTYACKNIKIHETVLWYAHIIMHGIVTFILLWLISIPLWISILAALIDFTLHFIMDFFVVRNTKLNNGIDKRPWVADIDQFFHCTVYVVITFIVFLLL